MPFHWHKLAVLLFLLPTLACTQAPKTADDLVRPFPNSFDFASNMGYYPPYFMDKELAVLAHGDPSNPESGIGITAIRPGLFDYFLDYWGFNIRLEHFRFYDSIGLRNTVVISGFPSERNRDTNFYCPAEQCRLFSGLYEPIWDHGENGTPVNENNRYALYLWKAANTYKGLIKIWEVWNEPDIDTGNGWLQAGQPGNWWENVPQPCETALKAPAYYYIRALRISYEVIKAVDPEAYVAVGGLGWPSYLDVICRYSDNPFDGSVDDKYPRKGGAYFDCMSFHTYPHLNNSLREWRNELNGFFYYRHSDAAIEGVWKHKNAFKSVLDKYGYDGTQHPRKIWICSEFNIPRKAFGEFIGSDMAQVNFLIKTMVTAQREGMSQMHVYSLADEKPENLADNEFSYMGLFKNLENVPLGSARPNEAAYALKTTSGILQDAVYDPVRTLRLRLSEKTGGAAFKKTDGQFIYVLWAKTTLDQDESSSEIYSFPSDLNMKKLRLKYWDFSRSGNQTEVDSRKVTLNASPVFLTEVP